jgi:integrase
MFSQTWSIRVDKMVGTFNPKYTYTKRGIYYFCKDVPADLRHHYTKLRIVQSLRTKSSTRAKHAAQSLVTRLEDYWFNLRLKEAQIPASHLLRQAPSKDRDLSIPTIVEALELYQRVKGGGRVKTFFTHSSRSIAYLEQCLGCRPLNQYTGADAGIFRDWLRNRELSNASVQRNFTIIKAVVNFTIQELGLECRNAFAGVYLAPDDNKTKRQPLSAGQIAVLQRNCYQADDDLRWLAALISDSGMRLAEAAGLKVKDIHLDCSHPHIDLTPYPHRRLKTKASERVIPLVGASLWAAKRVVASNPGEFCFPRYTNQNVCSSNSASAAINKWLKTIAGDQAVIHGLRHSFRDRLRQAEAPTEVVDQLGGWSAQTIGQGYGNGHSLEMLTKWMVRMTRTASDLP